LPGAIERGVGGLKHGLAALAVIWQDRHAQRQGDRAEILIAVPDLERWGALPQRFGSGAGGLQRRAGQDQHKFFAAVTTGNVFAVGVLLEKSARVTAGWFLWLHYNLKVVVWASPYRQTGYLRPKLHHS